MSIQDRGFAWMNRKRQREIASLGGKTAQANGTANRFTKAQAVAAGRKGAAAYWAQPGRPVAQTRCMVFARVSREEYARVRRLAEQRGVTVADVVRHALQQEE